MKTFNHRTCLFQKKFPPTKKKPKILDQQSKIFDQRTGSPQINIFKNKIPKNTPPPVLLPFFEQFYTFYTYLYF